MVIIMRKLLIVCLLLLSSCVNEESISVSKQISWGIGKDKSGKNVIGDILVKVRERINIKT